MSTPETERVVAEFHTTARQLTGLEDFGDPAYLDGMRVLVDSCLREAGVTDLGAATVGQHMMGALVGRLVAEHNWKQYPEALTVPIRRPFVIVGLPRTATTALQRMLATAPDQQGPEFWLLNAPQPRPPRDTWERNPMFQACQAAVSVPFQRDPGLRWIHDIRAELVDESWEPLQQQFTSAIYEIMGVTIPSYTEWLTAQDLTRGYERQRDVLRLIGLNDDPDRRWVLKDPTHIFGAAGLFNVYPDAMVIHAHRDPRTAIPSVCSLVSRSKIASGDRFDLHEFGNAQLAMWSRGVREFVEVRAGRPPEQFFDFTVPEFARDPLDVVRRAYEHFSLELTDDAAAAMSAWSAANPGGGHKDHVYDAGTFGLTDDRIDDAFADYIDTYIDRR